MSFFGRNRAARSSTVPSGSPADGTGRVPGAQGGEKSKRPRRRGQPRIPECVKQSTTNLGTGLVSTNTPRATVQYRPSGPASFPVKDQKGSEQRHELSDGGGQVERVVSTPETIYNDLESDNPKGGIPQNITYNAAWEELRRIRRIHHEEMHRTMNMADLMKGEVEDRDHFYQEKYEALVIENDELLQANSASTSRIALLEIQLSLRTVDPDTALGPDIIDSNIITLLTSITTITTTITTVTTRIERWKHMGTNTEQITISSKELERLSSDLFNTSSQMTKLQQQYAELSGSLGPVRNKLQETMLLCDEKDRTIATLKAEVVQWKSAEAPRTQQITSVVEEKDRKIGFLNTKVALWEQPDAMNAGQITTTRGEHDEPPTNLFAPTQVAELAHASENTMEVLRRDLTAANNKNTGLRRMYEAQSREVNALRDELKNKTSPDKGTINFLTIQVDQWKREDTMKAQRITSLSGQIEKLQKQLSIVASEADQWKHADAVQGEQVAAERRDKEKLRLDLAVSYSRAAELQKCYDAQSKDIVSICNELESKASLLEEKDHTISSLTAKVNQAEREDSVKVEQSVAARRDVEHRDGTDVAPSEHAISKHIAGALETRNKQVEELRRDLAISSSQIESLKRSDVTKMEELTTVHKELKQLRHDLSISSSQIIEYQQRCVALSARSVELTSQIEQWKNADTARANEPDTTREKVAQLQDELSTSSRITDFQQRYDVQSAELCSLHEQLQATLSLAGGKDRTITTLGDQVDQWKRMNATKAEELARASREVEQLRHELTVSFSQIEELQKCHVEELEALRRSSRVSEESRKVYERITTEGKDYAAIIKLTTTIDQWLRTDAKRAEDLALEPGQRNKENEELRQHLIILKEIYVRAPELREIFHSETIEIQQRCEKHCKELELALAERQSQLDDVQRFATMGDTYADAIIIQTLQKLNTEVVLTTTFMAEGMMKDFRPRAGNSTNEQFSMVKRVAESIGRALTDCLGKDERDEVELFLQIAFQVFITYYLRSLISSWTTQTEFNNLINQTYERLRKSEAQTISGRWRSLTCTYISPTCMGNPEPLISAAVSGLSAIVVAAGCAPTLSDAESKVSSNYGENVSSIISIAVEFSKMIGEVMSADFEVLTVRPSETFEDTTMEDVNGDDGGQGKAGGAEGQRVLCSTELGMTKRMQLESGESNTLPVMKAKVILESFLDE